MLNKILTSSKMVPQSALYRLSNNINVTEQVCLEAVKQNGEALYYVPEHLKTERICLEAVKQNGYALQFVPEHLITEQVCLEAVKQNEWSIRYVPEHLVTEEMCLAYKKRSIIVRNYTEESAWKVMMHQNKAAQKFAGDIKPFEVPPC